MEMRYSPIINGMLMFFVGVFFFFDSRLPKEPKKRNRKWRRRLGTSEVDHGSLAGLSGG